MRRSGLGLQLRTLMHVAQRHHPETEADTCNLATSAPPTKNSGNTNIL